MSDILKVMNISRYRMGTDSKGISTLVTLHGCPLQCDYCINDYCHCDDTEIYELSGEELVHKLSCDDIYFRMTNGGVVFGGGEPLLQAEVILSFVSKNMPDGWNVTIETSLNVEWEQVKILSRIVDYWIIDIKDVNPEIYKLYTLADNDRMLRNLKRLATIIGKEKIKARLPLIPGYNTKEDIEKSQQFIKDFVGEIEVFEYRQTKDEPTRAIVEVVQNKELYARLLSYIEYYEYSQEQEEVIIKEGEVAAEASQLYHSFSEVKEGGSARWEFDIALDCIRNMSEKDREYVKNHVNYSEYHFGYAMFIRNKYVWHARKCGYDADGTSHCIMNKIFTVLHPIFDYRNYELTKFYEDHDIKKLKEQLEDMYADVFNEAETRLAEGNADFEVVMEQLKETLREKLGKSYFKEKFCEMIKQMQAEGIEIFIKDKGRLEFVNRMYRYSTLFKKEYNQMDILYYKNFLNEVFRGKHTDIEECIEYLEDEFGFVREDAVFLSECAMEAFHETEVL